MSFNRDGGDRSDTQAKAAKQLVGAANTRLGGDIQNVSRRSFLRGGVGLSLAVALPLPGSLRRASAAGATGAAGEGLTANAFVSIGTDGTVTVLSKHLEMGQGIYTGLATLAAEELDAAWDSVRVEGAPADVQRYANLFMGMQGTGGSTGIANSYEQMRKAGAGARAMLVAAAAEQWGVPASEISVAQSVVSHAASGRSAGFGELASLAAAQPVPESVNLKSPKDFVLIGKVAPRKDSAHKTTGAALFTQDVKLPEMRVAVVAHAPRFGATLASVDDKAALAVSGVEKVLPIESGVAVLARDFWTAKKGRDALKLTWDDSKAWRGSSETLYSEYRELAEAPGAPALERGFAVDTLDAAEDPLDVTFEFPYLAHAAMEPMDCVMQLGEGGLTVWNGEQLHTVDQQVLAGFFGLRPAQVTVNTLYAGGGFGRRANSNSDYLLETARIVKAAGADYPVKLVWAREDDMRAGYYRPLYVHRHRAVLGENGMPSAWEQRIVGQSIMAGTPLAMMIPESGIDPSSVEGAASLPYAVPNLRVGLHTTNDRVSVPVLWWRSVGSTHTAYANEVVMDELAERAGKDPVEYRLALLEEHPRHAGVLQLAAEKAGWGETLSNSDGARRGRGVAVHESFASYVAQVVDVSVKADGSFSVDRVVCAVDCGVAVNPDNVKAQMEGGIGFALAAALYGEITLEDGEVQQSNYNNYQVLRMPEMPEVEVHIVPSAEAPTGVGEPGVPPLAPALANALYAATGQRLRRLPIGTKINA
jgi:isoquinoline 1-oxidoreductase beta subunit